MSHLCAEIGERNPRCQCDVCMEHFRKEAEMQRDWLRDENKRLKYELADLRRTSVSDINFDLIDAAKRVVTQWETPNWKLRESTAPMIYRLRDLLAAHAREQSCIDLSRPDDLRSLGLTVAVHNDYRLNGVPHTFWLMTDVTGMSYKGEGKTDAEALDQIRKRIKPQAPLDRADLLRSRVGTYVNFDNGCFVSLIENEGLYWASNPYGVDTAFSPYGDWVEKILTWLEYWDADRTETGEIIAED